MDAKQNAGVYRIQREVLHLKDTFEFNVLLALPYFVVLVLVLLGINVFVVLLIGSIAAIIKVDRRLQRRQDLAYWEEACAGTRFAFPIHPRRSDCNINVSTGALASVDGFICLSQPIIPDSLSEAADRIIEQDTLALQSGAVHP